ncbi:MAG: hypothetical protein LBD06_07420, partial [Candidatus Accumulibacter sp.]|nr:hypothetical protein [Accumulibacter sp.]
GRIIKAAVLSFRAVEKTENRKTGRSGFRPCPARSISEDSVQRTAPREDRGQKNRALGFSSLPGAKRPN